MPTLLCVPILVLDEHTALADAVAAKDAGADLVEFRIDELFSGSLDAHGALDEREVRAVLRLVAESALPCIVTCRIAGESGGVGGYDGDESARVSLYERLGTAAGREHPPRYIDMEHSAYVRSANIRQKINLAVDHPGRQRDVRTGLILSMHDFEGRPRDLLRRVSLMQSEAAARVVKVVYQARSVRDNLELFDLMREGVGGAEGDGKPLIALATGRFGLMSRVLAPKFGGFLTFASLREAAATAPGQPTLREMTDLYRFESISRKTAVYGVIGWPVEHSLGPQVHNAGFDFLSPDEDELRQGDDEGFSAVYLPLPVPPEWEHFKATLAALIDHPGLDFMGCSVTLPHKQHLVRYALDAAGEGAGKDDGDGVEWTVDDLGRACGAANTLKIERDPGGRAVRAHVSNTDASAAAECLRRALGGLEGRGIALIGSGGVARSLAAGLLASGAAVTLHARDAAKARSVAEELGRASLGAPRSSAPIAAELEALYQTGYDAVVNCTPVGMSGGPDPQGSPVEVERLRGVNGQTPVVFDTVYTPQKTPLLLRAVARGLRTIDGLSMFVEQAAAQFQMWTGREAPRGLFAEIAREALEQRERR